MCVCVCVCERERERVSEWGGRVSGKDKYWSATRRNSN